MISIDNLKIFSASFYKGKDIMHDISHIERVYKAALKLAKFYEGRYDEKVLHCGVYFHGFIYSNELEIVEWLRAQGVSSDKANLIVQAAWESQKDEVPTTLEGKILHDAHLIEGGKTFLIVKSLITGSVRGQTLEQTIEYIENNVLDKRECYLPEAQEIFKEEQKFAKEFIRELKEGIALS